MSSALFTGILTGIVFGTILYKAGAVRYSRVVGMLVFKDTKNMKFAFSAIATASFVYGLADLFGIAVSAGVVPRVMPFMGWAHVVGGVLFGVAMGGAGLCPGTCVARAGYGAGSVRFGSLAAVLGLVAGIAVFAQLKQPLIDGGVIMSVPAPLTLNGWLGIAYGPVALALGALFLIFTLLLEAYGTEQRYAPARPPQSVLDLVRGEWHWLPSGVLAGLTIVAATAQGGYLGFSGSLLALYGLGAHLLGVTFSLVPRIDDPILWRAGLMLGLLPGAFLASWLSLPSRAAVESPVAARVDGGGLVKNFLAGGGLSLGAMIGGGCTTGAFMSGFPTLSVGSMAMGATFFAVSVLTLVVLTALHRFQMSQVQLAGDRVYD